MNESRGYFQMILMSKKNDKVIMSRAKTSKTDILINPQSLTMLKMLLKTSAFKSLYGGKCTL